MKEGTSKKEVIDLIMGSSPEDYTYDPYDELYVHKSDINLRLSLDKSEEFEGEFEEPWVSRFPDKKGQKQLVRINYLASPICKVFCIWVDGYRHLIPMPKSMENLTINSLEYKIGSILNHPLPHQGFDQALHRAGITVRKG